MTPVNFEAMLANPLRQLALGARINPGRLDIRSKMLRAAFARFGGVGEAIHDLLDAFEKLCGGGFWGRAAARLLEKTKKQEEQIEKLVGRLTAIRGVMAARVSDSAALSA